MKGTQDIGILYKEGNLNLFHSICIDLNWGWTRRKSVIGFIFQLIDKPITWSSRLPTITLSSTNVEYKASSTKSPNEVTWLQHLVGEIGMTDIDIKVIHSDNHNIMKIANRVFFTWTKRIYLCWNTTPLHMKEYIIRSNKPYTCLDKKSTCINLDQSFRQEKV